MALSAHLFVISAAIAAAASAQELSGEICLYAGIRKATEMVFSFSTQLNTIPRKTQQGYLRMLINEEVKSGLRHIFHGWGRLSYSHQFLPQVTFFCSSKCFHHFDLGVTKAWTFPIILFLSEHFSFCLLVGPSTKRESDNVRNKLSVLPHDEPFILVVRDVSVLNILVG